MTARTIMVAFPSYEKFEQDSEVSIAAREAAAAARQLASRLKTSGYLVEEELLSGGSSQEIGGHLETILRDWDSAPLILLWTGHGVKEGRVHFLLCRDSPPFNFGPASAIRTEDIGRMVANSRATKILIIFDTCYSGAGAAEAASAFARITAEQPADDGRAISIIGSAHPLEQAEAALFLAALQQVLFDPEAPRDWRDSEPHLTADEIVEAVKKAIAADGRMPGISLQEQGSGKRFIPNPRYPLRIQADDVETANRLSIGYDGTTHFEMASRGTGSGQRGGWYFTGRSALLGRLARWLDEQPSGIAIVTGPPGAGKSAIVGRLLTLSSASYREMAARAGSLASVDPKTLPAEGIIDAGLHAKGKSLGACVRDLGLALDLPMNGQIDPELLISAVAALDRRVTIAVDAIDEALRGHSQRIARELIRPLASLPKVRVLVGTRRTLDGGMVPDGAGRHDRLREAFGSDAVIFDLSDEPQSEQDIAHYVRLQLTDSRHRDNPEGIAEAAESIARAAGGIFLYARIVARTLQDQESLERFTLPANAIAAFVADLGTRFQRDRQRVDDMLRALAWGAGSGLSRHAWPKVATALAGGALYGADDVRWMLDNVGWHIVETSVMTGGVGQATYRLIHQAFVDHYRAGHDPADTHHKITATLSEGIRREAWFDADPYSWRHLSYHAARADLLHAFLEDPGYLAVADTAGLLTELGSVPTAIGRRLANIYRRSATLIENVDAIERSAIIHTAAMMEQPELAVQLTPPVRGRWRCVWSRSRPAGLYQIVPGQADPSIGVAILDSGRDPIIAVLSEANAVQLWDARTYRPVGSFSVPGTNATCLAAAQLNGAPALAIGTSDGRVAIYDTNGAEIGDALENRAGVTSLSWGYVRAQAVIAAGCDDHTVRLWDVDSRQMIQAAAVRHPLSVTLGGPADLPLLMVSQGEQTTKKLAAWNLLTGAPADLSSLWTPSGEFICLTRHEDDTILVSADKWGSITVRPLRDGRFGTATLISHRGDMTGLAVGRVDGRTFVARCAKDGSLWIGDVVLEEKHDPIKALTLDTDDTILMVCFGEIDGDGVLAATQLRGFMGAHIELFDAATGERFRRKGTGPAIRRFIRKITRRPSTLAVPGVGLVSQLTIGRIGRRPVIAGATHNRSIVLWDPDTAQLIGKGIECEMMAHDLAISELAGRPLIAAPGTFFQDMERHFACWDPLSGKSMDERLAQVTGWPVAAAMTFTAAEVAGRRLFAIGLDQERPLRVWDAETCQPAGPPVEKALLSPILTEDRGRAVLVSNFRTLQIFDVATGDKTECTLEGMDEFDTVQPTATPKPLVYQGRLFMIAVNIAEVWVWDARSGKLVTKFRPVSRIDAIEVGQNGMIYLLDHVRGVAAIEIALPSG